MMNVTFCAAYKTNTNISRYTDNGYKSKQAAIVEIDKENPKDMEAMYKLSELWGKFGNNYSSDIFTEAGKDDFLEDKKEHIVVLTLQNNNFNKLNPKQILGIAMFSELEYDNEINWMQVYPKTIYNNDSKRKYRKIGSAILDYIISNCTQKNISVNAALNAINFYTNNNFKAYDEKYPYLLHYNI